MKLRNYLLALVGICMTGSLSAQQVYFSPTQLFPTDVNNEGQVLGHRDQAQPHEIWTPETGKLVKIPQSIGAGPGAGGNATFSGDGTKVAATMICDEIPLPADLAQIKMFAYPDITFGDVYQNPGNKDAFMVGTSADGQKGVVLQSGHAGQTWMVTGAINMEKDFAGGMVSIASLNWTTFIIGGHNGGIYFTKSGGRGWEKYTAQPEGNTKEVSTYWTIDFMPGAEFAASTNGVMGVEFKDKTYAVWYTEDGGDHLNTATGVNGLPTHIGHFADAFYLTTANGHAQKSLDYGKTWTDMFVTEGNAPLQCIEFYNETLGMALGTKGVVYVTTDGGDNWSPKTVAAGTTDNVVWNDMLWKKVDNVATATIVGSGNSIYETKDNGVTWTAISVTNPNADANLCAIAANDEGLSICGTEGTVYWKSCLPTVSGTTAGIYDIASQEWTVMESLGYVSDGMTSSPYCISANGEYVLGSIYTYEVHNAKSVIQSHAAVWTKDGEVTDLGSKFADRNRATRASACSFDGSVIVGHQDIWGPWYSCVWRRQSDGTYTQKLMFKDANTTEEDIDFTEYTTAGHNSMIKNCLGLSRAISLDGKWITGRGEPNQTAVGNPWLWSEETGLILMEGTEGTPVYVNNEGTVAIGYGGGGFGTWIWRKGKPMLSLEQYATELGVSLKGYSLVGVYNVSRNGRYVTGACMKGDAKYGYMFDMLGNGGGDGIESVAMEQCHASVYPNPVSDELHVDFPYDDVKTNVRLLSQQGMVVKQMTTLAVSNTMYLNDVPAGLYILDVEAEGVHRTYKVEVVH